MKIWLAYYYLQYSFRKQILAFDIAYTESMLANMPEEVDGCQLALTFELTGPEN